MKLDSLLGSTKPLKPQTVDMVNTSTQPLVLQSDTSSPIKLGAIVLILGFGGFLLWAGFAPLDEGVPSEGAVSIETKRKAVQHLTGGIVTEVNVKEGQMVTAGDILMAIDNGTAKAHYEEIRQHYLGLRAQEGRLVAEKVGSTYIVFHEDLMKAANDPLIQLHMQNQSQLLNARQSGLSAELAGIREAIQGQEAQIQGYKGVLESRHSQLTLLNEQLKGINELVKEGYAPRNQQNDLEQKVAQVYGEIADAEANVLRSRRSIGELTQRSNSRRQNEKKEIDTQMAQVRLEVQADAEKFKATTQELSRTEIRSPASGQVVGLQVQTVGAVIQSGQKLMDIVPLNEGLLLEAKVAPHLIDRIHTGSDADIRFSSFANSPQLVVKGKVDSISKDLISDAPQGAQPGFSYYLARISITPDGMKVLGNRRMQPGMPVQIIINTGERTLLTYLLHPLTKRISASLKEE